MANIGISLPGTGELPVAPVYEDGKKTVTLKGDRIAEEFQAMLDAYVARTYGNGSQAEDLIVGDGTSDETDKQHPDAPKVIPIRVAQQA